MKLTVLTDNVTLIDHYFLGEPAVSYYIESRGRRILFDTGYSDVFLRNADAIGIDLTRIDAVVLSHGHNDHCGGLPQLAEVFRRKHAEAHPSLQGSWPRPLLVTHPATFYPKLLEDGTSIGAGYLPSDIEDVFEYLPATGPVDLGGGIRFMGKIPRYQPEAARSIGYRVGSPDPQGKGLIPDPLEEDSALLCSIRDGEIVVTGCSHAGIVNVVRRAGELGTGPILDIIGGFHLLHEEDARVEAIGAQLLDLGVRTVHPCHCTDFRARMALARRLDLHDLGSGTVIEYP